MKRILFTLSLLAMSTQVHAGEFWTKLWRNADQQGEALMQQGDAGNAAKVYADPHRRAYAKINAGDYQGAAKELNELHDSDADYNRGNALAHAGDLQGALDAYDAAIKNNPNNQDARHNRELVATALKQQPPQQQPKEQQKTGDKKSQDEKKDGQQGKDASDSGKQDGQEKPGDKGKQEEKQGGKDGQGKNEQGKPGQADNKSGKGQDSSGKDNAGQQPKSGQQQKDGKLQDAKSKDGKPEQGKQAGQEKNSQQPQPGQADNQPNQADNKSGKDQHAAAKDDTEQARRDAEASLGKPANDTKKGDAINATQAIPANTPKSEKQIAQEQWLRSIPDDPGGLLRRKFLIEHMMKQQKAQQ